MTPSYRQKEKSDPGQRGQVEIFYDICQAIAHGSVKRTAIMFGCNLSFDQLKRYIAALLRLGFIRVLHGERVTRFPGVVYELTEFGRRWLTAQAAADNILQEARQKQKNTIEGDHHDHDHDHDQHYTERQEHPPKWSY